MRRLRKVLIAVSLMSIMLASLYQLDTRVSLLFHRHDNHHHRQQHLYQVEAPPLGSQKMLIYVCDQQHPHCAGWSDRQRAITTLFLLATVTRRRFGVIMTIPCDVAHFYQPSSYDWRVGKLDLKGKTWRLAGPFLQLGNASFSFDQLYPEDVIFVQTNKDFSSMVASHPHFQDSVPAWAKQQPGWRFRDAWNMLMKPTPRLEDRVQRFLLSVPFHNRTRPFVGVHVRMGKNPSNPNDSHVFNTIDKLGPLWAALDQYVKNGSHLFTATDSAQVREMSRQRYGAANHDTDGSIMHSGHHRSGTDVVCKGFEDALLDQLILSHCDVLFRSLGGFSLKAFYLGRKKEKMFLIRRGSIEEIRQT